MSNGSTTYYIRIRGKIHGPFDVDKLRKLHARGQFSRGNEVSADKRAWEPAAALIDLFSPSQAPNPEAGSNAFRPLEPSDEPCGDPASGHVESARWHYNVLDQEFGPVSLLDLQRLVRSGQISERDFVWKEGMADWIQACSVKALFSEGTKPVSRSNTRSAETATRQELLEQKGFTSHPMDHIVEIMRQMFPVASLQSVNDLFMRVGKYGLYVAIASVLFYYVLHSIKTDSVNEAFGGVSLALSLFVLQYASVRLFGALETVVASNPTRMTTTAFADSVAVACMVVGLVIPAWLAIRSIREETLALLVASLATFAVCEYLAAVALNPSFLNITLNQKASAREEAIGVVSFFIMLQVRVISFVFGVGIILATLGMLWAISGLWTKKTNPFERAISVWQADTFSVGLLLSAAIPLIAYVCCIFCYLIIDMIRAVLLLPPKLDALQARNDQGEAAQ